MIKRVFYFNKMRILTEDLVVIVSDYFNLSPKIIFSKTRVGDVIKARQFFFCMAKKHTTKTLAFLGTVALDYEREKALNHATVLHSCRAIEGLCETYKEYRDIKYDLRQLIDSNVLAIGFLNDFIPRDVNLLATCQKTNNKSNT